VENNGESAITEIPQTKRKARNTMLYVEKRKKGEKRQHKQEMVNAMEAIFLTPYFWESNPPKTQDGPPDAITRNEINGTLRFVFG
jgi:hypothetical protein